MQTCQAQDLHTRCVNIAMHEYVYMSPPFVLLQDEAAACRAAQRSGGDEQVGGVEERGEGEDEERKEPILLEEVSQEIHRFGRAVSFFLLVLTVCMRFSLYKN